jgi:hypothetical protein
MGGRVRALPTMGRPRGNAAEAALGAVPELTRGGLGPASLGQVHIIIVGALGQCDRRRRQRGLAELRGWGEGKRWRAVGTRERRRMKEIARERKRKGRRSRRDVARVKNAR